MSIFPGSTPSFAGFTSSHTLAQDNHASQHNSEQAEIIALANKIGIGSSTPASSLVLRGTDVGTSAWSPVNLTSDVTGVLPQANGGTGTTLATGTGKAVYDTSPTISGASLTSSPTLTTPTIADFTNSTHTHASNAQGGQLNAANALTAGSINFANLLSTIFSGQLSSQANAGTAGGTINYINLGGIKLAWGLTGTLATSGVAPQAAAYTITWPVGFFSTIQFADISAVTGSATNSQYIYCAPNAAVNTTSWGFQIVSTNGSNGTTSSAGFIAIGT